ncbi:hypothetical protein LC593_37150 [Nostoc sp. CHAB 5844]|nr:hypothetical protein [Nostoc sp. CHAB 5844]
MEVKNAKQRKAERQRNERSKPESESRSMGTFSGVSANDGSNQIRIGGKNSDESNTSVAGEQSSSEISGKIIRQLVDETEKQLAYHEQQAELLREMLKELKQVPEVHTHTD